MRKGQFWMAVFAALFGVVFVAVLTVLSVITPATGVLFALICGVLLAWLAHG